MGMRCGMTSAEQQRAAKKFAEYWQGYRNEKAEAHSFWFALLRDVFGIAEPEKWISFEKQVFLSRHTGYIDGFIANTHVLIEQKSSDKDLLTPIRQSNGSSLTPFEQALQYIVKLPYSEQPRWVVTCNFAKFLVYDREKPSAEPLEILLENLPKEYHLLQFLVNATSENIKREMELSMQAGELVGALYDAILKLYHDPTNENSLKSLNKLCVRLVFCLYAEDAGIFPIKNQFHDYLAKFEPSRLRGALIDLFKVLDTKPEERDPYLLDDLAAFPYVNGGLFLEENIEIPNLNDEVKNLLLAKASDDFDWSSISPTIFGAVFESTLNPETRRSGGMHYTSIENIHKVIDPLFLDELRQTLNDALKLKDLRERTKRLRCFQEELAALTFLDPACGSGNFLTETFLSLRRLENEAIKAIHGEGAAFLGEVLSPVLISIDHFYGIEINDFAVAVAKTALWIAESQMLRETEEIVGHDIDFLPLKTNASIIEGNALKLDWNTVVPKERLDYIMGNPPFVGARLMNSVQKEELVALFPDVKNTGNLDYVSGWYQIAADMMEGTSIRAALVSTNSITQGEQPVLLWKHLMNRGITINFAHRTFRWDSESNSKAHVHCVIIGFSYEKDVGFLFNESGRAEKADHINPYLVDAPDVFVESNNHPLCDVPEIGMGNQPIDDGNYLFLKSEMEEFIQKEPASEPYFKLWYGAEEFIHRKPRYCLWLGECSPAVLRSMPECLKRVIAVREFRQASKRSSTLKLADKPTHFQTENMPKGNYIVIPETSSEKRRYCPIGFLTPDVLCSNAIRIMPDATLYHFGVLMSSVHMAWLRAVCGRLKSDYRYSINIVYNNFPWPEASDEQKKAIEETAQGILDARNLYPDCSLADLYDENTMPFELRKAHQTNDLAVMKLYGYKSSMTEPAIVADLMKRYQKLANYS